MTGDNVTSAASNYPTRTSGPTKHCEGCDDDQMGVERYLVRFGIEGEEGTWEECQYCPECAALARANWNLETLEVVGPISDSLLAALRGLAEAIYPMHRPIPQARAEALQRAAADVVDHVGTGREALRDALVNLRVPVERGGSR